MKQRIKLERGDCREVLPRLSDLDACVTDPPYELGFMGKRWDASGVAFQPEMWRAVYDALKPGAHLLAFGGTRTFHRMTCAIEDAGFELRDTIMWLYGSGFPKSLDVSKAIDKAAGAERTVVVGTKLGRPGMARDGGNQRSGFDDAFGGLASGTLSTDITAPATPEAAAWSGWGTALKPAWEPIIVARKPLDGTVAANTLKHGCGGLNIDGCRVPHSGGNGSWGSGRSDGSCWSPGRVNGASEPEGQKHELGRLPANVIHDGSDEVEAAFAAFGERSRGVAGTGARRKPRLGREQYGDLAQSHVGVDKYGDTGTASRFFYSTKASKSDRADSKHPTVKPLALMRYLCKLVTPPGGTILDPFAGSGTTLQAAAECGFNAVGIEMTPEYQADIARRIARMKARP